MFQMADFYGYCRKRNISVIPYNDAPSAGTTIRDGKDYAIFLDFKKIKTVRELRGTCLHELGHEETGALHKISSPYDLVEQHENMAIRWSSENVLTVQAFAEAFQQGYTEPWQLAEYYELPEEDIKKALRFWTERRGINFNIAG